MLKKVLTSIIVTVGVSSTPLFSNELLPYIEYIKEPANETIEKNIDIYNKSIQLIDNNKLSEAEKLLLSMKETDQQSNINKKFALFKIFPEKYQKQIVSVLDKTNEQEQIEKKMYLNLFLFGKDKDVKHLNDNLDLFKKYGTNDIKPTLLLTETYIKLKQYEKALIMIEPIKEINLEVYGMLLLLNQKYDKSYDIVEELYKDLVKKDTVDEKKQTFLEWMLIYLSLKTNNSNGFSKYTFEFETHDEAIKDSVKTKHTLTLQPNYINNDFSQIKKTLMTYKDSDNFFHVKNIFEFLKMEAEDIKEYIVQNTDKNNEVKISLKKILFSKDNIYTKTYNYLEKLKELKDEQETFEYYNAGLLLSKINKEEEAIAYFRKSFLKNNNPLSGTLYLILDKYLSVKPLKITLFNQYVDRITHKIDKNDTYTNLLLKTFAYKKNKVEDKELIPPEKFDSINQEIITKYLLYINTKDLKNLSSIQEYDEYLKLLYILFYNINEHNYAFTSYIQDNLFKKEQLYYKHNPIVGDTYIKMLVASNFINLPEYKMTLDKGLLFETTYLLNYAKYLLMIGNMTKASAIFEEFIAKSKMELSLDERILYTYINFKNHNNGIDYLVQSTINSSQLNIVKVLYYLQKNDYVMANKYIKHGLEEKEFMLEMENTESLLEE